MTHYICKLCDAVFEHQSRYERHVQRFHPKQDRVQSRRFRSASTDHSATEPIRPAKPRTVERDGRFQGNHLYGDATRRNDGERGNRYKPHTVSTPTGLKTIVGRAPKLSKEEKEFLRLERANEITEEVTEEDTR